MPGKIYIDATTTTGINLSDTAYVNFYYYNYKPNINLKINGQDYNTMKQNYAILGKVVVFLAELQSPLSQYNIDDYFFQWQVDDNLNLIKGKGLNTIRYNFLKTGIYNITLLVTDPQKCTYKYVYRIVILPSEETIMLTGEVNTNGRIILNIANINNFRLNNYTQNSFIKKIKSPLIVGNEINDTINIEQINNFKLTDSSQLTIYLKFAGAGNLNIKLLSPNYKQSNYDFIFPSSQLSIWGMPSCKIFQLSQSFTKPYFFNTSYQQIQTEKIPFYYSPDNELILPDTPQSLNIINGSFYQFQGLEPLIGETIKGQWRISLELDALNSAHGYIEEYGLIFDKNLYEIQMMPEQLTCTDQFGRIFDMKDNIIAIDNIDVPKYFLDCKAKYPNIDTLITKKLEINVNNYSNIKYFTPNGDGINDTWLPVAPESKSEIIIINKLGQIVTSLKSENYLQGWDGNVNGKPVPSDSYWYIIKTKEGAIITGIINIVR